MILTNFFMLHKVAWWAIYETYGQTVEQSGFETFWKAAPGWQGQQQGGGEELGWGVPPSSLWLLLGRRPTGNWGPPLLPPYFPSLPHPRILPNLFINSTISTWHLHGQWTHVLDLVTYHCPRKLRIYFSLTEVTIENLRKAQLYWVEGKVLI